VDSFEAALWAWYQTDSFSAAVLAAANLGQDADTTGAVVGQLAGAFYGLDGIRKDWREKLVMGKRIEDLAFALIRARG
jgi:ADP-ribosyl-[dinitrogen reductase] hydrolase